MKALIIISIVSMLIVSSLLIGNSSTSQTSSLTLKVCNQGPNDSMINCGYSASSSNIFLNLSQQSPHLGVNIIVGSNTTSTGNYLLHYNQWGFFQIIIFNAVRGTYWAQTSNGMISNTVEVI